MTALVVDVGNTSTAIGLWSDGRVSSVVHCDRGAVDPFGAASALLTRPSGRRVSALAYVSVVPREDRLWRAFAKGKGLKIHQVSHRDFSVTGGTRSRASVAVSGGSRSRASVAVSGGSRSRVTAMPDSILIDYPRPETIGADRLADAAGAVSRYGAPVLVMDFGTALTAAVVTRDRVWRGGVIAPGFPLMRDYLFERTAKLPRMKIGSGKAPRIGRSTEEAMRFGALVGYRGMVREIVTTLKRNFNEDFRLVATGGFARWVLGDLDLDFTIDPTLTLYGAGCVAGLDSIQPKSGS